MTKKIKEELSNINKISKNLIKYGSLISYFIIVIGLCMLFLYTDNDVYFIAKELIKSAFLIFAEVIIGGLFFDLIKRMNNNND